MHDPDFRASEQDFKTFLDKLSENISELDSTVPELPVKDIVRSEDYEPRRLADTARFSAYIEVFLPKAHSHRDCY